MADKVGDLRVWWNPQIGMVKSFYLEVSSVEQGVFLMDTLAKYDDFQWKNNIKPDYCNAGGLEQWSDDIDGEGTPGWESWQDEESGEDDPGKWLHQKNCVHKWNFDIESHDHTMAYFSCELCDASKTQLAGDTLEDCQTPPTVDWWCIVDYTDNMCILRKGCANSFTNVQDYHFTVSDEDTARQFWEMYNKFQTSPCPTVSPHRLD